MQLEDSIDKLIASSLSLKAQRDELLAAQTVNASSPNAEIVAEIYAAMDRLGAESDLLGTIGSWGDSLSDEDVLANLQAWNAATPAQGVPAVATKAAHTPGPWIAKKGAGWFITRLDAVRRREAAIAVGMTPATTLVSGPDSWFDESEAEANAHLMAAAPQMAWELGKALAALRSPQSFDVDAVCEDIEKALRLAGVK